MKNLGKLDVDDIDVSDISAAKENHAAIKLVTNPSVPTTIRLNPYLSSPEKALSVMGRICSAKPSDNMKKWNSAISEILFYEKKEEGDGENNDNVDQNHNLMYYFSSNRFLFANQDFIYNVQSRLRSLLLEMDRQMRLYIPKAVFVSVGGLFSGGKSSLLNYILDNDGLLPVNIGASTMVPAMLYCGNLADKVSVSGVNNLDAIVSLDTDILNCISHSDDENKISSNIATTLQHFIVQVRNKEYQNIVFVDTPGYDNAEDKSARLRTDDELADKYLSMGDVILWLMPAKNGSFKPSDIDRLVAFGEGDCKKCKKYSEIVPRPRKIIILITKADLLDEESRMDVFRKICDYVSTMDFVEDVALVSAANKDKEKWNKFWHSRSGNDFVTILKKAVNQVPVHFETTKCIAEIQRLFDSEISASRNRISEFEQKCQDIKQKCLYANSNILKVKRQRVDFFEMYNYQPEDVKKITTKYFDAQLNNLENEYKIGSEKINRYAKQKEALEDHLMRLQRWSIDLEKWFESEPILDYHGRDEFLMKKSNDKICVYLQSYINRKFKNAYVHFWDNESSTHWPGIPMVFVMRSKRFNIWKGEIPNNVTGIVFALVNDDGDKWMQSIDFTGNVIKNDYLYNMKKSLGKLPLKYQKNLDDKMTSDSNIFSEDENKQSIPELSDDLDGFVVNLDIFNAIRSHNYDNLLKSLAKKRDITGVYNQQGMSAVTAAAHFGFQKALMLFVHVCGVEILNIADKRGFNALHSACAASKFETAAAICRCNNSLKEYCTIDGRNVSDLVSVNYKVILKQSGII